MSANPTRPLHLLLIEDDEDDYVLFEALLATVAPDYQLSWHKTYTEGLKALLAPGWNLALVDYFLAGHDGPELIKAARAQGCQRPIILHTGKSDPDLDQIVSDSGASAWLSKSAYDGDQLLALIQQLS